MKRLLRILLISIALLIAIPACSYAAPVGYTEVALTKKNAKKYFTVKKVKDTDEFGDYSGYSIYLCSKLRNKGYFLYDEYDAPGFAVKYSYKARYKYKYKKRWYKYSNKGTTTATSMRSYIAGGTSTSNYKYGKASIQKIKKVKGSLVFIEPWNVIGIEYNQNWGTYRIKLRYPYSSNTPYESHWDENTYEEVIDYYYIYRYDYNFNLY